MIRNEIVKQEAYASSRAARHETRANPPHGLLLQSPSQGVSVALCRGVGLLLLAKHRAPFHANHHALPHARRRVLLLVKALSVVKAPVPRGKCQTPHLARNLALRRKKCRSPLASQGPHPRGLGSGKDPPPGEGVSLPHVKHALALHLKCFTTDLLIKLLLFNLPVLIGCIGS
uniref:Uncharacterized protein n=2 Tax=Cacopsylla melanoneura TaxID=428564 RepID=A0A8D8R4I1_9HEMI